MAIVSVSKPSYVVLLALVLLSSFCIVVEAFGIGQQQLSLGSSLVGGGPPTSSNSVVVAAAKLHSTATRTNTILYSTLQEDDDDAAAQNDDDNDIEVTRRRTMLKRELLQLGASFDRGFGASPSARKKVDELLNDLEVLNPEIDAARGISGEDDDEDSPLIGNWRMIWTTAPDVLTLAVNPTITVGAIYQIFDPPIVTNVIDLLPRIQNLLPPSLVPNSLLRANVQTRASERIGKPMRIGLDFESVSLEPIELLGQQVQNVLPPLGFDLPKLFDLPDDVGYFDVSYLDNEILIIRQNEPGGLFVLTRVNDSDP